MTADHDNEILPRSRIVRVEFEFALPVDASKADILEWVEMEACQSGGIDMSNPLAKFGIEGISEPTLTDTGLHLHEEARPEGDGRYSIRRWKDFRPFTGTPAMDVVMGKEVRN